MLEILPPVEVGIALIQVLEPTTVEVDKYREKNSIHPGTFLPLARDQETLRRICRSVGRTVSDDEIIDVYNPSLIFDHTGTEFVAGRVECSGKLSEHSSIVVIFRRDGENWIPLEHPLFTLQDPHIAWIDGRMVLSGVELSPGEKEGEIIYRSAFFTGDSFENLERFSEGPWNMKGIRITKLGNGKIGIYTRPQGEKGGLGQIGFIQVDTLDEVKNLAQIASDAPLLNFRFPEGEWGGVNQVIPMDGDRNLLIGHRAYKDIDGNRHYLPWACVHNYATGDICDLGILAERKDFPDGPAKAPDLIDVLYTAGIVKRGDKWFLIVGISDTQSGIIEIEDPLSRLKETL